MSDIARHNQPCPSCSSSDACQVYVAGDAHCFSCDTNFQNYDIAYGTPAVPKSVPKFTKKEAAKSELKEVAEYTSRGFEERRISKTICEFYGVKVSYNQDGRIDTHYYPYQDGNAYKVRALPKSFRWIGKAGGVFGQELFNPVGKRLVICEGEIDTLSVAQASYDRYGKMYPVIGLSSSGATKEILEIREWVRGFDTIIIVPDNDEPGKKCTKELIEIIGVDKARIAKLPCHDANEVYLEKGPEALMMCVFDASPFIPSGILSKEELWKALEDYSEMESVPYPPCLTGLNSKLKGMRAGEITLFTSGTGAGKSSMMREILLHVIQTTDSKVGIVALEESPAESARKFAGLALSRNPAKDEIPLEELKVGFDAMFGDDRAIILDHAGSMDDGSIVETLEYMCLSGATYIMLDHITILVSESAGGMSINEGTDKIMASLLKLVKRYPVWIGLISHLRKKPAGDKSFEDGIMPSVDDLKGSGSLKQISHDIVAFTRNLTAEEEVERNHISMCVLKSRFSGLTGYIDGCSYDYDTGRLSAFDSGTDGFEEIPDKPAAQMVQEAMSAPVDVTPEALKVPVLTKSPNIDF